MPKKKINPDSKAALKKSGTAKLAKVGKTTSEAHLLSALRQGQITKSEAAAIDPKKFKVLLSSDVVSSKTIDLTTGKVTRSRNIGRGGGAGGLMGSKIR